MATYAVRTQTDGAVTMSDDEYFAVPADFARGRSVVELRQLWEDHSAELAALPLPSHDPFVTGSYAFHNRILSAVALEVRERRITFTAA